MPTADQTNISAASRTKARVVRIFGINPDDLTAHHIQEADKALRGLRNRFLFTDAAAAHLHRLQRIERRAPGGDLSKVDAFDVAILSATTKRLDWLRSLLHRANASDLLTRTDYFSYQDPMVKRIHRAVLEDPAAKQFIGSRHTTFRDPIGVIQSILAVLGFSTESRMGPRSEGRTRHYRIADPFTAFNPDSVLNLWRQHPELPLDGIEEPSADAGGTDYP